MMIQPCTLSDVNEILSLYQAARTLQTERRMVVWPEFERSLVEREINEGRQWKIVIDTKIACNWSITFEDKAIWGEKDKADSVFIHRICTNPSWRGNRFIDEIVSWSKAFAQKTEKKFIRLDTLGNNTKLIKHYTSAGFSFLGIFKLTETHTLPKHYQDEPNCCLFEIDLQP